MKKIEKLALVLSMLLICGCAYRHYLGMHGPSMRQSPAVHRNATGDAQCLSCHHPGQGIHAPDTSHPGFKGCFKCHND